MIRYLNNKVIGVPEHELHRQIDSLESLPQLERTRLLCAPLRCFRGRRQYPSRAPPWPDTSASVEELRVPTDLTKKDAEALGQRERVLGHFLVLAKAANIANTRNIFANDLGKALNGMKRSIDDGEKFLAVSQTIFFFLDYAFV